ncbi:EcWRKY-54, partial [Eragrostis curvula]
MEGIAEERCALVGELVQVLEMVRKLDAHMAGGEEQCRALVATMRASIDRSVLIARSCCAEAGRVFGGHQPESSPSGGDGSPRSGGSDQAGDSRGRGNAAGHCKKRKMLPKWSIQVRVRAVADVAPLDDGLSWRKYGQKDILGAKYPRAYFRCTHRHTQGCNASKQVQRTDGDPLLFDVVYHGDHTCAQGQPAAHPGNQATAAAWPAVSSEHSKTQSGPEPEHAAAASPSLERAVLPFPLLSSNKPAATSANANDDNGCEASIVASTFMLPAAQATTEESQLVSGGSNYTAGVRNVADGELASTTTHSSSMGDMDFMFQLDDAVDFLESNSYF